MVYILQIYPFEQLDKYAKQLRPYMGSKYLSFATGTSVDSNEQLQLLYC